MAHVISNTSILLSEFGKVGQGWWTPQCCVFPFSVATSHSRSCSLPVGLLSLSLSACSRPAGVCDLLSSAAQTVLPIYTLFRVHSTQETQHELLTIKVVVGFKSYILYSGSAGFDSQRDHWPSQLQISVVAGPQDERQLNNFVDSFQMHTSGHHLS